MTVLKGACHGSVPVALGSGQIEAARCSIRLRGLGFVILVAVLAQDLAKHEAFVDGEGA